MHFSVSALCRPLLRIFSALDVTTTTFSFILQQPLFHLMLAPLPEHSSTPTMPAYYSVKIPPSPTCFPILPPSLSRINSAQLLTSASASDNKSLVKKKFNEPLSIAGVARHAVRPIDP